MISRFFIELDMAVGMLQVDMKYVKFFIKVKTPKDTTIESSGKPPVLRASGISPMAETAIMMPAVA